MDAIKSYISDRHMVFNIHSGTSASLFGAR